MARYLVIRFWIINLKCFHLKRWNWYTNTCTHTYKSEKPSMVWFASSEFGHLMFVHHWYFRISTSGGLFAFCILCTFFTHFFVENFSVKCYDQYENLKTCTQFAKNIKWNWNLCWKSNCGCAIKPLSVPTRAKRIGINSQSNFCGSNKLK